MKIHASGSPGSFLNRTEVHPELQPLKEWLDKAATGEEIHLRNLAFRTIETAWRDASVDVNVNVDLSHLTLNEIPPLPSRVVEKVKTLALVLSREAKDFGGIRGVDFPKLKELKVTGGSFSSLESLPMAHRLKTLEVNHAGLEEIGDIVRSDFRNLVNISLVGNKLTTIVGFNPYIYQQADIDARSNPLSAEFLNELLEMEPKIAIQVDSLREDEGQLSGVCESSENQGSTSWQDAYAIGLVNRWHRKDFEARREQAECLRDIIANQSANCLHISGYELNDLAKVVSHLAPRLEMLSICEATSTDGTLGSLPLPRDLPEITHLYIDNLQADGNIDSLQGFPNTPRLIWLEISGHRLRSLEGLPPLPNLEILDLRSNSLVSLHGTSPGALPALRELNLGENELRCLDGLPIAPHSMLRIHLPGNPLERLPAELLLSSNMSVYLRGNQTLKKFIDDFAQNRRVRAFIHDYDNLIVAGRRAAAFGRNLSLIDLVKIYLTDAEHEFWAKVKADGIVDFLERYEDEQQYFIHNNGHDYTNFLAALLKRAQHRPELIALLDEAAEDSKNDCHDRWKYCFDRMRELSYNPYFQVAPESTGNEVMEYCFKLLKSQLVEDYVRDLENKYMLNEHGSLEKGNYEMLEDVLHIKHLFGESLGLPISYLQPQFGLSSIGRKLQDQLEDGVKPYILQTATQSRFLQYLSMSEVWRRQLIRDGLIKADFTEQLNKLFDVAADRSYTEWQRLRETREDRIRQHVEEITKSAYADMLENLCSPTQPL